MGKKTIIITGGTGYIGSNLAIELLDQGYEIALIDNLENSDEITCNTIHELSGTYPDFYRIDLSDNNALDRVFNYYSNIVCVIHCANIKVNGTDYYKSTGTNINAVLNLLTIMEKYNVNNLIYTSSSSIYSDIKSPNKIKETENLNPSSSIGTLKLISEKLIKDACKNKGINCLSLRLFNVVGTHISGKLGKKMNLHIGNYHKKNYHVFYNIFDCIDIDTKSAFVNDCFIENFKGLDFVDINDVTKAYSSGVRYLQKVNLVNKTGIYGALNIGSSVEYSLESMVKIIESVLNKKIVYKTNENSKYLVADISRANKFLPWIPTTSIQNSIMLSWDFYQKELELYRHNGFI